jgi:predicted nucleic acid-binding protein
MPFVLDASIAASWFLPDEQQEAADGILHRLRRDQALVPALFWTEMQNILLVAERRSRIDEDAVILSLNQLYRLPIGTAQSPTMEDVLRLARRHGLSAYDATYLALAKSEAVVETRDRRQEIAVGRPSGRRAPCAPLRRRRSNLRAEHVERLQRQHTPVGERRMV